MASFADGVIVGSALVRCVLRGGRPGRRRAQVAGAQHRTGRRCPEPPLIEDRSRFGGSVCAVNLAAIPSPTTSVWHVLGLPVRAYALCIVLGIVVAVLVMEYRLRRRGVAPWASLDMAVWAVPFGIVGARIYHVITSPGDYFGSGGDPIRAFYIWEGGLGIWGAVAGGALGAWIAAPAAGPAAERLRRRAGAGHPAGPGGRPVRQLVQQRAVRQRHHAAVGPAGARHGPGQPGPRDGDRRQAGHPARPLPPHLPVRGGLGRRRGRAGVAARPPVQVRPRPGVRALRDGVHGGPVLDRDAAHRRGQPTSSASG